MSPFRPTASRWIAGVLILLGAVACSSPGARGSDGGPGTDDGGVADSGLTSTDGGNSGSGDGGTLEDGGAGDGGVALTIRTLTPPLGSVTGNTNIVIYGSGFANTFAPNAGTQAAEMTSVWFITAGTTRPAAPNVLQSNINVIDDSIMEVVSPVGGAGLADVVISNPNGLVTCSSCYTYVAQITVSSLSPTSGPIVGGTALTITGTGFATGMLVLVAGAEATNVVVSPDGTTITATTPPGTAGSADVGVIAPNAEGWMRRGFVYYTPIQVMAATPPVSPLAGGGTVTITGSGFTPDAVLILGGQTITPNAGITATQFTATIPAATMAGAVAVEVQNEYTSATLPNGFAYYDTSASVQIYAVVPSQGPIAGGGMATVLGTGLVASNGLQVAFGANLADSTTFSGTANALTLTVPAAQAAGLVDVQARTTTGGGFNLPQSYAYIVPLTITGVSPASGSESGGTGVTITGTGFDSTCQVFIGAGQATTGTASATSISATTAAGSAGAQSVRVVCGTPGAPGYQQATLASAFTYTAAMNLLSLDPGTGAIAGNTAVTLYGDGFVSGMTVFFGGSPATMVQVSSASLATVRTPPGSVGYVDVTIAAPGTQISGTCPAGTTTCSTLPQSFGYYDPTNVNGGGSNGPMLGILNVTVLNSTPGESGPIPGATVSVNQDQLTGVTDARGQVTFSDPSLLKPVNITASMTGFAASTIALINARDVTIFMEANQGASGSGGMPSPAAVFTGEVCGFKLPPNTTVPSGQVVEAQVYQSFPYVYAAPPFGTMPTPVIVTKDCGAFTLSTGQYGPTSLYAIFGIADNTSAPPTFTPILMGVARGLQATPGVTSSGIDLILSMHLDQTFPVTIDETELGLSGDSIMNEVFSYLDLGGEGVVPLAQAQSTSSAFPFTNHPDIEGQGIVFLNLAAVYDPTTGAQPPYSLCFQQQFGDLSAGVSIGPMMAFTSWVAPQSTDVFSGSLSWSFLGGNPANIEQIELDESEGFSSVPIWQIILPGTEDSVTVPASAAATFPPSAPIQWTLITAQSPNLVYDAFGFEQLGVNDWTSFTENFGTFQTAATP